MAIKLNYRKLDLGVIMNRYSEELLINGFSFLTEFGRILEEGLFIREREREKGLSYKSFRTYPHYQKHENNYKRNSSAYI